MSKKRKHEKYPIDISTLPPPTMINFQFIKKNADEIKNLNSVLKEQQSVINKLFSEILNLKNEIEQHRTKSCHCQDNEVDQKYNVTEKRQYSPTFPDLEDLSGYSPTQNF